VKGRDRVRLKHVERQAEGYLELGMNPQALEVLNRLGEGAGSAHALYLRGEALRGLQRYQEALVPLHKAAEKSPEDIHVLLALGWCHKRTARLDLAIADIERALGINPGEALLHYNLACYLCLAGDKRRSLAHLARALALDARYREMIETEPDFDSLRDDPDFQAVTSIIV